MTRRRGLLYALLCLAALAGVDAALALSPEQLRRRLVLAARPLVGGGDVEIDAVRLRPLSRVRLPRVLARPRIDGDTAAAGEIEVKNLIVEHAALALLRARYEPLAVSADEVRVRADSPLRLLQALRSLLDVDLGDMSLPPPSARVGGEEDAAPVSVRRLVLEVGGETVTLERVEARPRRPTAPTVGAPGAVRVLDLRAGARTGPMSSLDLTGLIDLERDVLSLDVRASNVDLASPLLARIAPDLVSRVAALRLTGAVEAAVHVELPWLRAEAAEITGLAEAFGARLAPDALPHPITNVMGRLRLERDRVTLEGGRGLYGRGEVHAEGEVGLAGAAAPATLRIEGRSLDLLELRGVKLPAPLDRAIAAIPLEGRAALTLRVTGGPGAGVEARSAEGTLTLAGVRALGGAFSRGEGKLSFRTRRRADGTVTGTATLELAHADLLGAPLERVRLALVADADGLALPLAEGRLAGGALRASGRLVGGAAGSGAASVTVAGASLGSLLSALHGRPIDAHGLASGTLTASADGVRIEGEVGEASLGAVPLLRDLGDRVRRGSVRLERRPGGGGRLSLALDLDAEGGARLALDLGYDERGRVEGEGVVGRRRYQLSGPFDAPEVTCVVGGE